MYFNIYKKHHEKTDMYNGKIRSTWTHIQQKNNHLYKKIGECFIFVIKIISCELRLFKQLTIEDFVIKAISKDMFVIQ